MTYKPVASLLIILVISSAAIAGAPASQKSDGDLISAIFRQFVGPGPNAARPVFAKAHGCVKAEFKVNPDLPEELRIGVFSKNETYPAWIRFANDGGLQSKDADGSAKGMAIKLVGVPGKKILEGEEDALTQDFVMQNHPIFFNKNSNDFLKFMQALLSGTESEYNKEFPYTEQISAEIRAKKLADPLDGQYWTPTPYRLGAHAVKYMAKPCEEPADPLAKPMDGPHFLRSNLVKTLQQKDSCMNFYMQLQKENMPLDDATIKWDEEKSPFLLFATLHIPKGQNILSPPRKKICENLSMTGWHSLPEHIPLGSVNEARKVVYKEMADLRRLRNGVEISEPTEIGKED